MMGEAGALCSERVDILGIPLDLAPSMDAVLAQIARKDSPSFLTFIAPHSWAHARKNPLYLEALQHMTMNVPGRAEVAWMCRRLRGANSNHFDFNSDEFRLALFKSLSQPARTVMLVGGRPAIDEAVQDKLASRFPELKIIATVHGYGDFEPKIAAIMARGPEVVLVDMGTPRQEVFLLALAKAGFRGSAITCGGFFDQYINDGDFYPRWVEDMRLYAAWRLLKSPASVWQAAVHDYLYFVGQAVRALYAKYVPGAAPAPTADPA